MKFRMQQHMEKNAGFSLVEVALALLVVAIGLTSVFALFPEGIKATRSAVDDTEIGFFAEYVFTTLDLAAGQFGNSWRIEDTDDFKSPVLARASKVADQSRFELVTEENAVFYWTPDFYGLYTGSHSGTELDSSEFENEDFWTSAFTYHLTLQYATFKGNAQGASTRLGRYAVLKVWPGEYLAGVKPREEDARIFYREVVPIR